MFATLFTVLMAVASAEYRVYQLKIVNGDDERQVLSTLDENQYPTYYPLAEGERISYLDSWMCWQRSDNFAPYCPKPKPKLKAPAPAKPETGPSNPG